MSIYKKYAPHPYLTTIGVGVIIWKWKIEEWFSGEKQGTYKNWTKNQEHGSRVAVEVYFMLPNGKINQYRRRTQYMS